MDLEIIEGEVFFLRMRKAKRETTKDFGRKKEKTRKSSSGVYK